jgi:iron complex outermembrane recepter protein
MMSSRRRASPVRLARRAMACAGLPCAAAAMLLPQAALAQATGGGGVEVNLPSVNIIGTSPLLGSGIDRNKLPAETNILNSGDISRDGTPDVLRALNEQVGGVNLNLSSGNPDQPDLLYHGFEASPLQGTSQGLAVYVNGVRFNDPFGDTVNWEVIPSIAISQVNLEGPNPVFGLNALGGSLSVQLKDGFTYHGGEARRRRPIAA